MQLANQRHEQRRIYLDHAATTPVRNEVIEAMMPFWTQYYGNPSSVHHFGQLAFSGLDRARMTIAELINAQPNEIIFTGCGSESDNLAIRGVMWAAKTAGLGNHLITCAIEHKAVLETAKQLQRMADIEVTILPVDSYGRIDLNDLEAAIRPETILVSIMAANNEIGTLQPVGKIGQIARQRGILFHTDAIQAAGVTPWDMQEEPIDLLSLAPHKFYGPKGVGILYARQGVELVSILTGGGQEDGRRAGTENVAFAVGAAEALRLAYIEREENISHYKRLSNRLIEGILHAMPEGCVLTGHPKERLPQTASFALLDVNGNDLLRHLDVAGISASSGSACLTGDPQPSSVLKAIGLGERWTRGGLRLSVGRQNNEADIDFVIEKLPPIVEKLLRTSALSP